MATEAEKTPAFPKYPEAILEAIAQDPKEGANKSAISKYIESKFGDVPAGHVNQLTTHLNRMKEAGEIVFFKNNYLLPDPTAPPRRGRGRPPKAKDPSAETTDKVAAAAPTSPRGRGRPRKDPNAEPAPKKPKPAADETAPTPEAGSKTGRPRGRPRKVIQAPAAAAVAPNGGV